MSSWERELLGDALILGIAAALLIAIAVLVICSIAANAYILWDPGFQVLA